MKFDYDAWMYDQNGPRLFKSGDEIPAHYVDSPVKVGAAAKPRRGRPPKLKDTSNDD